MIQKFESFLQGGASKPPTLPAVAKRHGISDEATLLSLKNKQLELGVAVESEHADNKGIAEEIALDHLWEDPAYYTKLVKAGLVDEPSALSLYKEMSKDKGEGEGLKESYYDGEPDLYREIDYDDDEQLFELFIGIPLFTILTPKRPQDKLKADKWVVRTLDLPEEYALQLTYPSSEIELQNDADSAINYATDLLNDPLVPKSSQDWLDLETDLAPIDTKEIVSELIDELESYLSPGYDYDREFGRGEYYRKHTKSRETFNRNSARRAIHFLDNYTP
jgi:hypothetical protein